MFERIISRLPRSRAGRALLAVTLVATVTTPAIIALTGSPAHASGATNYTTGTAQLATITNGTTAAPWNEYQGDPASATYASVSPGTVLPTYTPGGATTTIGGSTEPNLAVYPGATSGTAGNSPYPSGVVGTPGPLDAYCGTGNNPTEATGTPARQPAGTVLPLAPAYFPHIVRNSDGSLTGYFDYRPKDADEALVAAKSTDNGADWTYLSEALEQDPGYCPTADTNDDGEGHANIFSVGGVSRLYTLPRAAGDNVGVGMMVHTLSPTAANPLNGAPAVEQSGIDPDAFAASGVSVAHTGGTAVSIAVSQTGAAGSPEQLLAGKFVDLTATPVPTAASIITCTAVGTLSLTGCTTAAAGSETITTGDLIEQVIGTAGAAATIPVGPNNTLGTGGLASLNVTFATQVTAAIYNNDAPNRAYLDGVAVYCSQANANPTSKIEDCTTAPGTSALTVAVGDPLTSDPIIPATATQTSGLVAPDGIVGVLPSYPGAPGGSTVVMYTEKILSYYVAGTTTNGSSTTFGSTAFSVVFNPSASESQDMPATISAGSPVTVQIGDATASPTTIIPMTCTGLTTGATDTLTGCTVPSADATHKYSATSLIGAPGATTVSTATLGQTGEGSSSNAKLLKNNEDLTVLRVADTTDGINFSTTGLANGGVISGASNGVTNYSDISNPALTASPSNLNLYATPGTQDAVEMRFVGSAGSIITNPDGSYGLFLSGAWGGDGDSDAFNQVFYSTSTNGENWSIPTMVVSTDYTFADSVAQDTALAGGTKQPLGISAYYEGRAYGPSVVQNPNGTLTMMFAGYRLPKTVANAGTSIGTNASALWTIGATDPTLYRNIMVETLNSSTSPGVTTQTTATESPSSPVVGQPVTYTATVSVPSPGAGTPTGTMAFTDAAGTLCVAASLNTGTPDIATCTTTYTNAGSDTVTATYSDDSNYAASSGTVSATIGQAATTTAVTATTATPVVGQAVTYTATISVTSPGAGTPTGTVAFADSAGPITACAAQAVSASSPDTATCTAARSVTGADTVTATYSGDTNFTGSSGSDGVTVGQAATTTAVTSTTATPVVGQPITYTATVSVSSPGAGTPTGTVSFTDPAGTVCAAAALSATTPDTATCATTYTTPQGDTVTATYGSDANFAGSSATTTVTVGQAATSTAVTATTATPVVGQPIIYTATVTATPPGAGTPTGTVTFSDPAGTVCAGAALSATTPDTATCATTYTTPQGDTITATYSGDTNDSGSSGSDSVTVGQSGTSTSVTATTATPVVGQSITYTATVSVSSPGAGTPTGTVTFTDPAGTVCAAAALSATTPDTATCATTYTTPQADTITATYSSDTNFSGSSGTTTVTVGKAATATTVTATTATPQVGQPITYTATITVTAPGAGNPAGTVAFADTEGPIAGCSAQALSSASPYIATCATAQTAAGVDAITATYGGDTNDAGSSGTVDETVGLAATTTALTYSTTQPTPLVGQAITYSATVSVTAPGTGAPTGTVGFADSAGPIASCSAQSVHTPSPSTATCTVTETTAGSDTVTATYSGSTNFGGSAGTANVTVGQSPTSVAVTPPTKSITSGGSATFSAAVSVGLSGSGEPTGTVTFSDNAGPVCTAAALSGASPPTAACAHTYTVAGSDTITAAYSGDANFAAASGTAALTVAAGPVASLVLSPATSGVVVGSTQIYAAEGFDAHGNDLGNVTSSTTFTLAPSGGCAGAVCTPPSPGTFTVTGTDSGATGTATLTAVGQSISLTSSVNPTFVNVAMSFDAEVRPVPAGGTVSFTDNGEALGSCTNLALDAQGGAFCAGNFTNPGAFAIVATYTSGSTTLTSTTLNEVVSTDTLPPDFATCDGSGVSCG